MVGLATVLGAGGGTSSYKEIEETDVILLWGSNAREAHPIFFHHLLKGIDNGATMFAVDPRRTSSAKFADVWLGLEVGSDVAMANTVAREIIAADLHNKDFVARSTQGFEELKAAVEPYTLERGAELTGVPAEAIREMAHAYATADSAQILWTLGITEHHNAVDNVLALCNLALLTGHVGRWGSGLVPLRGQNNVQGGGDMGSLPDKLPGFQNVNDDVARGKFEAVYGVDLNPEPGIHLTLMFEAMERGEMKTVFVIGENPADSEADIHHARKMLEGLDLLVVQDIFMTRTAEMADVVLPASVGWAESDGTVTSSERRVQRVRAAVTPPGEARHDIEIIFDIAARMGMDMGDRRPRGAVGRAAIALAHACRYELGPARVRGRPAMAVPVARSPGFAVPAQLVVGRRSRWPRPSTVQRRGTSGPEGRTQRTVPAAPYHRSCPRFVQHRCAVRRLQLADSLWRCPRYEPRRRHRYGYRRWREGSGVIGPRFRRDGSAFPARHPQRPDLHHVPFPRAGRCKRHDQRCVGQTLWNRRVQSRKYSRRKVAGCLGMTASSLGSARSSVAPISFLSETSLG